MPSDKMIIFEFIKNGETILMDDSLFSVTDYEGIESSDYELVTESNIRADGDMLLRKHVLSREIMVNFDYLPWSKISEMRQKLIRFFSPYSGGVLKVTYLDITRTIDYEVSSFKINNKNVHEELSCLLYVKCLDPSFKSAEVSKVPIMTLIGGWKWKFRLPFRMKQYGPLKRNIYNSGHMETPVEIYFRGPAVNPKITNHRTGGYVRLKKTLTSDDVLYIDSAYGKKTVEIRTGDNVEDGWDYLDQASEFWWLQPGDNMIEYTSDGESIRSKGVEIYYWERYLGV